MIYSPPGDPVDLFLTEAPTGLAGTLLFRLENELTGAVVYTNSIVGISEPQPGTYRRTITAPDDEGYYIDVWTNGSTVVRGEELLRVTSSLSPIADDAPYFTVGEFRARYSDEAVAAKTDQQIEDARALAEEAFEHACEVAFVPRTVTGEKVSGSGTGSLILRWPRIRSVTAVSADGTALTGDQLALLQYGGGSVVGYGYRSSGWFWRGNGNVVVSYEHGYDQPPAEVKDAVMVLTRDKLVQGPVSDRRTSMPTENGPIALARPGIDKDHPFGIDDVDSVYQRHNERSYVG